MTSVNTDAREQGLVIANEISRMHHDSYGRGAARARTVIGDDHVIVFLEDVYTKVERTLIRDGKFEIVKKGRQALQQTMRQQFVQTVEETLGRRVTAFMSQVHESPEMAMEAFALERDGPF